ncbi:phenylalanine 4-monooxygenase [Polymorphobacter sp. PAMC 29334]|uniref:phenylalanine 4-monooxygenase n=1 Tax=Polymorphobacter sp. PAMC 29334 TaxID=2862331 RepID=UPI001C7607EE|nr:phenylalanine 4-monooxygenase [Polymorphobacter sp. PAMC 29334]QYE34075.1 phenylalanine 4-monooxygenase [Polymorphobacter sp. PAMC 29334]
MITAAPPEHAAADWTIDQRWADYTPADHALWDRLYARQTEQLADRAHPAFLDGLATLDLSKPGIPDFEEMSDRLEAVTGWRVVAVPGLVPDAVFYQHLAERRFVAGNFIRSASQIDYLEAPDVFHDVFGHVPLLSDPVFADYMQAYGQGGLRSLKFDALTRLSRLYWYTVEFGLVRHDGDLKLYGAGIVSSHGESVFALDDASPHRIGFDLGRVMRTPYKIDDYQALYVVIDSFEQLLRTTLDTDFAPLYTALATQPDIAITDLQPGDTVINRGTQRHGKTVVASVG